MPQEYGNRYRAYKRDRLWCDQGLWPRIVAALADPTAEVSLSGVSFAVKNPRRSVPMPKSSGHERKRWLWAPAHSSLPVPACFQHASGFTVDVHAPLWMEEGVGGGGEGTQAPALMRAA